MYDRLTSPLHNGLRCNTQTLGFTISLMCADDALVYKMMEQNHLGMHHLLDLETSAELNNTDSKGALCDKSRTYAVIHGGVSKGVIILELVCVCVPRPTMPLCSHRNARRNFEGHIPPTFA